MRCRSGRRSIESLMGRRATTLTAVNRSEKYAAQEPWIQEPARTARPDRVREQCESRQRPHHALGENGEAEAHAREQMPAWMAVERLEVEEDRSEGEKRDQHVEHRVTGE